MVEFLQPNNMESNILSRTMTSYFGGKSLTRCVHDLNIIGKFVRNTADAEDSFIFFWEARFFVSGKYGVAFTRKRLRISWSPPPKLNHSFSKVRWDCEYMWILYMPDLREFIGVPWRFSLRMLGRGRIQRSRLICFVRGIASPKLNNSSSKVRVWLGVYVGSSARMVCLCWSGPIIFLSACTVTGDSKGAGWWMRGRADFGWTYDLQRPLRDTFSAVAPGVLLWNIAFVSRKEKASRMTFKTFLMYDLVIVFHS